MSIANPLQARSIFCDEAGFTGDHMLDEEQPVFTFASVAVEESEAKQIVSRLRAEHPRVQGAELKGARLAKSTGGRALIHDALRSIRGRYLATIYDKKFSLACKFFEYIFEPVLARNSALFYANDFHRFIGALVYMNFVLKDEAVTRLMAQFENFMRSLNPADAPVLFTGNAMNSGFHETFLDVARFIDGYRSIILDESKHVGSWVLDLSLSGLFSQIAEWGDRLDVLSVFCDESKPLDDLAPTLNVMVNRTDRSSIIIGDKIRPLTFNLAQPVQFVSSSSHYGVQLADIVSSTLLQAVKRISEDWTKEMCEEIEPHLHDDCILPNLEAVDLGSPKGAVNGLVLRELGERAQKGLDPLVGMEQVYQFGYATVDSFLSQSKA